MDKVKDVIDLIEATRKRICGYTGSHCDCKYGLEVNQDEMSSKFYRGEQTGCPELRDILVILEYIPQAAWDKAIRDMNKNLNEKWRSLKNGGYVTR